MKEQTEKSKYPSLYSPGKFITVGQYILELICQKKAQNNKTELPIKFWNLPEWQSFWKTQLRKCHSLLKIYDGEAIIKALNHDRAKYVFSLHAPFLEALIKEEQRKLDINKKKVKPVNINRDSLGSTLRGGPSKKNTLNKLRELDG